MVFKFPFSARLLEVSASLWLMEPILDCVHHEKFTPVTGRLLSLCSLGEGGLVRVHRALSCSPTNLDSSILAITGREDGRPP